MTSPVYPVFEGDGGGHAPKRPTASVDLGGLLFTDNIKYPPKDREQLSSTDYMQATMTLERVARMIPVLIVDLLLDDAPDLAIVGVVSVNDALTTANVTVSKTATGRYRVSVPSGKLPTSSGRPTVEMAGSASGVGGVGIEAYTATQFDIEVRDYAGTLVAGGTHVKLKVY
jgi:hypothetical protein